MSHPKLLTKSEAAEYLGIAERTLDDWRSAGAIPCVVRPGYVRFLIDDLNDFLMEHRVEGRSTRRFQRRKRGTRPQRPEEK
jgi:predicted site-specific integrase-resolvase